MSLIELVAAPDPDRDAIRAFLDGMSHAERVHATRSLPRTLFPVLYDMLAGGAPVTLNDMVPEGSEPFRVVRHHGINSLLMFRVFQKPMYRNNDGVICGRNVQFWAWLTGHGYFTVRVYDEGDPEREVVVDYINLPAEKPEGWPTIHHNARGLSYFVYRDTNDVMRQVSEHVTIGKALRNGKPIGAYFILVREDPEAALAGGETKALPAAS